MDYDTKRYHKACLFPDSISAPLLGATDVLFTYHDIITLQFRPKKMQWYIVIVHQTHYEKSDWSRAFDQFTIACELDIINAISAADITFIMSSSTSARLLSPLECSPHRKNGRTLRFCFWGWIMWKMYNKTIIEFGFRMISWIIKTSCLCYDNHMAFLLACGHVRKTGVSTS